MTFAAITWHGRRPAELDSLTGRFGRVGPPRARKLILQVCYLVESVAFSRVNNILGVGGADGTVWLWHIAIRHTRSGWPWKAPAATSGQ